jgi:hypothetical protein
VPTGQSLHGLPGTSIPFLSLYFPGGQNGLHRFLREHESVDLEDFFSSMLINTRSNCRRVHVCTCICVCALGNSSENSASDFGCMCGMCVCVCVCVCVCAHIHSKRVMIVAHTCLVCVCVCGWVGVCGWVWVCGCGCVYAGIAYIH